MLRDKSSYHSTGYDTYGFGAIEDLLHEGVEWRKVQDVVRLSIRGLLDIQKSQAEQIKDLEKHACSKVSKQEFLNSLSSKANVADMNRSLNELSMQIDNRISVAELQSLMKDQQSEVQQQLQSRISTKEFNHQLNEKVGTLWNDIKMPLQTQISKLEEFKIDFHKRLQSVVKISDLDTHMEEVKLYHRQLQDELEQKCSKQQLQVALQQKINRIEVESLLSHKADPEDVEDMVERIVTERLQDPQPVFSHLQHQVQAMAQQLDNAEQAQDVTCQILEEHNAAFKQELVVQHLSDTMKQHLEQIKTQLQSKCTAGDHERITKTMSLHQKESIEQLQKSRAELYEDLAQLKNELRYQKRSFDELLHEKVKKLEQMNDRAADQIVRLKEAFEADSSERKALLEENGSVNRAIIGSQKKEFLIELDHMRGQLDALRRDVQDTMQRKFDSRSFSEFQVRLDSVMEQKVDVIEMQNAMNSWQADLQNRLIDVKDDVRGMIQSHDLEFFTILNKKANAQDVNESLEAKADARYVQSLLEREKDTRPIKEFTQLHDQLGQKCTMREFEDFSTKVASLLQEITSELQMKAAMTDVLKFLDMKSNHDEVARAFQDIQREITRKANIEEIRQIQSDQAVVNESLCTENIVARWTYKQGPLSTGSLIPWNTQVVNTLPENFLWEKDKPAILVVAPGLYEITLGFYAKKKPKVDVLVNGEAIIGAVNSGSYVVHHSSGKLRDIKGSTGIITGLTMIDFIVLPARARIALAYQGDLGEGFLGLKRL